MYAKYDPKECSRCSKVHLCTGTIHCPCFNLEITETVLEYIAANFDECLCNDCMAKLKNELVIVK